MKKKHSLVIGGTRGIGRAIVKNMSNNGYVVSVIGLRAPSKPDSNISNVHYWATDLSMPETIYNVLGEIISKNGKLNNLVFSHRYRGKNNDWRGEIQLSLTATKNAIDYLSDKFEDDGGSIVVISSIASNLIAEEQPLSYHIAKAGINQMIRYYAVKLGPRGIRFNCISSGTILKDESKDFYLKNEKLYNLYKSLSPLNRMGTSEDIAHAVMFLSSPKASFINGTNLVVDGGISLRWHESLARKLSSLVNLKVTREPSENPDE